MSSSGRPESLRTDLRKVSEEPGPMKPAFVSRLPREREREGYLRRADRS